MKEIDTHFFGTLSWGIVVEKRPEMIITVGETRNSTSIAFVWNTKTETDILPMPKKSCGGRVRMPRNQNLGNPEKQNGYPHVCGLASSYTSVTLTRVDYEEFVGWHLRFEIFGLGSAA